MTVAVHGAVKSGPVSLLPVLGYDQIEALSNSLVGAVTEQRLCYMVPFGDHAAGAGDDHGVLIHHPILRTSQRSIAASPVTPWPVTLVAASRGEPPAGKTLGPLIRRPGNVSVAGVAQTPPVWPGSGSHLGNENEPASMLARHARQGADIGLIG